MRLRARSGLTLLELLIAVLIMGIMATAGWMMTHRSTSADAERAGALLVRSFQAARSQAIARGEVAVVSIDTTDAISPTGRYLVATLAQGTPPTSIDNRFWTPFPPGIVFDPGTVPEGPMPGSAPAAGLERATVECFRLCDLDGSGNLTNPAGPSYLTYYIRHIDDPSSVVALVLSQSGQMRLYRYRPTGQAGVTEWE